MKEIHGCEVSKEVEKVITDFADERGFKESIHSLEYCISGIYFFIGNTRYHLSKNGEIVPTLSQTMIDELFCNFQHGGNSNRKYKKHLYSWYGGAGDWNFHMNVCYIDSETIRNLVNLGIKIELMPTINTTSFSTERNSEENIRKAIDIVNELG